jgi:hypothetical protein
MCIHTHQALHGPVVRLLRQDHITIPADVLDEIDAYAEREGFTRSGFLALTAKKAMAA